jgi:hypothetical protein
MDSRRVPWVGARGQEVVVRDVEHAAKLAKFVRMRGDQLSDRNAGKFGCERVLETIVVRARDEMGYRPALPAAPADHVGDDEFKRETDVR